ncbi:MAG TPA: C4-type zinc ribbon domain-containing protein [Terriglobales bacterium]|nr:C4-type zinc ribbon domain-containing protein [Terriglobales bacterium]
MIEEKLAGSKDRLDKAKAALKTDEANRRKYEGEIQNLRQKISKYRDQMLAVKTNQEYRALGTEVEFAEKEISGFEDKILETMIDVDDKNGDLKRAESDLKAHTAEIEKEKAEARSRTAEDEKALAEWSAKRDQYRSGVSAETLRHYDRVLTRRGSAIAEARDHKCSACQVMLRPQVYSDVMSNEQIIMCDSCNRILYFVPTVEADLANEEPRQLAPRPEADAAAQ